MIQKNKRIIGLALLVLGYFLLAIAFFMFIYNLEYKLAFENKSILHINLSDTFTNFSSAIMIWTFILIILLGYLMYYGKDAFNLKDIGKKILVATLFIIEVGLASILTYLVVLWKHLYEKINFGYLMGIILGIILIDNLRRKIFSKKNKRW